MKFKTHVAKYHHHYKLTVSVAVTWEVCADCINISALELLQCTHLSAKYSFTFVLHYEYKTLSKTEGRGERGLRGSSEPAACLEYTVF